MSKTLENVLIEQIHIDETFNCRGGAITPSSVFGLAESIEKNDLIQPIVLRTFNKGEEDFNKKYTLVAGFRRLFAVKSLLHTHVMSIVHQDITADRAQFINFSENLDRKDLTIFEEAQTLAAFVLKINPKTNLCYTEFDIMDELNKSRGWVQPRIMLMRMPELAHQLANDGHLTATAIRDLNRFQSMDDLKDELQRIRKEVQKNPEKRITIHIPTTGAKRNPAIMPKQRKRKECNSVLDWLMNNGYKGTALCKGIAWAAGNISDLELLNVIKREMDARGAQFEVPEDGFVRISESVF